MSDPMNYLLDTTDAQEWAKGFCSLNSAVDEGTMLAWFASAIETGRSAGLRRAADTRTPSFTDDEMEAIRLLIFDVTHPDQWVTVEGPRDKHVVALRRHRLSESVIAWVLSDPSPAPCETCGGSGAVPGGESCTHTPPLHSCPSCGGEK